MKKLYQGHPIEHIDQYTRRDRFVKIFKIKYCPNDKNEWSPRGEEENTDSDEYVGKDSYGHNGIPALFFSKYLNRLDLKRRYWTLK